MARMRFKERARSLRAEQTRAEEKLWERLRSRRLSRWKFRRQHPVDRFIVDFVTLDGKLIVEVDGATHSTDEEVKRDAKRTRILESLGFHVIRVSNNDVRTNIAGVLDTILNELERQ
jgi:very-short-patch-repair endonuclease